ncbi:thioesterase II family protein [Streptacidiphilus neutrinimicus]|uniref:thioesterase II family protein n=1 Tax=Streptacidiphilus neutrinimicus TaxID=105420 RepID=UPI000695010A|nr:alpha/beta fold hydrolase [Streptacidiphilus neutrinimicus]
MFTPSSPAPNPWLQTVVPRPAARLRLLCFHPAGSGTSFYRPWAGRLPADIEVSAVSLPGREARYREPLQSDYSVLLSSLYAALRPTLAADRRPYALFGHSMGALLAYGVALTAARLGDPGPERLLLSGMGGPGTVPPKPGRPKWSDEALVADLREMGGTPEEVLAEPELLHWILPVLRADYSVCDTFRAAPPSGPLLTCPLTLMGGADDHATPPELARWAEVTAGPATQYTFPGGHFYLTEESPDAVLATLTTELTAQVRRY